MFAIAHGQPKTRLLCARGPQIAMFQREGEGERSAMHSFSMRFSTTGGAATRCPALGKVGHSGGLPVATRRRGVGAAGWVRSWMAPSRPPRGHPGRWKPRGWKPRSLRDRFPPPGSALERHCGGSPVKALTFTPLPNAAWMHVTGFAPPVNSRGAGPATGGGNLVVGTCPGFQSVEGFRGGRHPPIHRVGRTRRSPPSAPAESQQWNPSPAC